MMKVVASIAVYIYIQTYSFVGDHGFTYHPRWPSEVGCRPGTPRQLELRTKPVSIGRVLSVRPKVHGDLAGLDKVHAQFWLDMKSVMYSDPHDLKADACMDRVIQVQR